MCLGLLLLVFSMIESPIFSKILYIIGFKGDRDRGALLLWQATRYKNFNSAIAGMALFGYYNGLVGFCDILPTDPARDDYLSGYPRARLQKLLAEMRLQHPESKLWRMEEARMLAYNKDLVGAAAILEDNAKGNMKQIAMINVFEQALIHMFTHQYELTAETWIKCSNLSSWSPTLYYYMAGIAYLEHYRSIRDSDPAAAAQAKIKAEEYIKKGPPLAGKQKVMAKQLPFDIFIVAKVQKWTERAEAQGVDLADAVGVSPYVEMMFWWNGIKKCDARELEQCLRCLDYAHAGSEDSSLEEERVVGQLLRASVLRNLERFDEARALLLDVLSHDRFVLSP